MEIANGYWERRLGGSLDVVNGIPPRERVLWEIVFYKRKGIRDAFFFCRLFWLVLNNPSALWLSLGLPGAMKSASRHAKPISGRFECGEYPS